MTVGDAGCITLTLSRQRERGLAAPFVGMTAIGFLRIIPAPAGGGTFSRLREKVAA
jgi:hypothetical protein